MYVEPALRSFDRTPHPIQLPTPPCPTHDGSIGDTFQTAPFRTLGQREQLFREAEVRTHAYLVVSGAFVLYRLLPNGRRQVTGFASAGDVLGLGAVARHPHTAEASSAAKVRTLPVQTLHRIAEADGGFAMRLYQAVSRELESAQDLLLTIGRLDAGQRLAGFLVSLSASKRRDAQHRPETSAGRIDVPMTRCDIADYLGLTTETISRNLTKLANRGIIARVSNGALHILDHAALQAVADGDLFL